MNYLVSREQWKGLRKRGYSKKHPSTTQSLLNCYAFGKNKPCISDSSCKKKKISEQGGIWEECGGGVKAKNRPQQWYLTVYLQCTVFLLILGEASVSFPSSPPFYLSLSPLFPGNRRACEAPWSSIGI